jgi:hypothetical protein
MHEPILSLFSACAALWTVLHGAALIALLQRFGKHAARTGEAWPHGPGCMRIEA